MITKDDASPLRAARLPHIVQIVAGGLAFQPGVLAVPGGLRRLSPVSAGRPSSQVVSTSRLAWR
ncbi:MAG: hypothetical protein HY821_00310 [Acidobacteria bacterium]|nr:hypothetical protein [Acidobacteriota bacterium]